MKEVFINNIHEADGGKYEERHAWKVRVCPTNSIGNSAAHIDILSSHSIR